MDRTRRWPSLAPDVVRDVANRLHDVGDFVRLHAVCKPWRASRDEASPLFRTTNQFLPWLLAAADEDSSTPLRFRCIFSKSSYRAPPPQTSVSRRNWVGSADATAVLYLTVENSHPSLHNPLTGEVTPVPPYLFWVDSQRDKQNPHGIIYVDGTILLYSVSNLGDDDDNTARFRAALLRPRDAEWTLVKRTPRNEIPRRRGGFCTAYHNGTILILEDSHWRVVTPGVADSVDVLVQMPCSDYPSHSNYLLECRGELLWVSVHAWIGHTYENGEEGFRSFRTLSVLVHALEDDLSAPTKMRWVRKYGPSLADRVLFLGSPNSFAMDASQMGGHGGCVYFVYYNHSKALPGELFGVFRYNLVDGKTEFVERVPPGWDNEKCTWFAPQPAIAPIQKITKWKREDPEPKLKKQKTTPPMTHISRHYEPCFRVMVRNLPPTVNSSELQLMFSKLARQGNLQKDKALGGYRSLNHVDGPCPSGRCVRSFQKGLYLDGCKLEVTFFKERRRPRLPAEHQKYM